MTEKRPKTIIIKKDSLQPFILPNSLNSNQFIYLNKNTLSDKTPKLILIKQPTNVPVMLTKQGVKQDNTAIEQKKVIVIKNPQKMYPLPKDFKPHGADLKLLQSFQTNADTKTKDTLKNKIPEVFVKPPSVENVTPDLKQLVKVEIEVEPQEFSKLSKLKDQTKNDEFILPDAQTNWQEISKNITTKHWRNFQVLSSKGIGNLPGNTVRSPGTLKAIKPMTIKFKSTITTKNLTTEKLPNIVIQNKPRDEDMFITIKKEALLGRNQTVALMKKEEEEEVEDPLIDEDESQDSQEEEIETEYLEALDRVDETSGDDTELGVTVEEESVEQDDPNFLEETQIQLEEETTMEEEPLDQIGQPAHMLECTICEVVFENEEQKEHHMNHEHTYSYECMQCGQTFTTSEEATIHFRQEHEAELVYEAEPGVQWEPTEEHVAAEALLSSQNEEESEENALFCTDCNMLFTSKQSWVVHILTAKRHKQERKQITNGCRYCGETFDAPQLLKEHIDEAHPKARQPRKTWSQPEPCVICGEMQENSFKYWAHFRRSHPNDKYPLRPMYSHPCDKCDKKFRCQALLKMHQNQHTGERPFACDVCGKCFYTSLSLRYHAMAHSEVRPFRCPVCDRGFKFKAGMERHQLVHTGERPYVCGICNQGFTTMHWTRLHVRKVHHKEHIPYKPRIRKKKTAAKAERQ